jgi:hypothetical protein
MNGTIVALNRNIGVLVVQTDDKSCVVLEAPGVVTFTVGEQVQGDWNQPGKIVIENLTNGGQLHARVQKTNVTRSEAIGSMSII